MPEHTPASWSRLDRRQFLGRAAAGTATVGGLGVLLAACGSESGTAGTGAATTAVRPPSTPTGTLRVANPGEPNFIDPSQALEVTEWSMVRNVYDGLAVFDADYVEMVPALATAWTSNDDATVWTFQLREGVTFHDGEPFDAAAAKRTIEYYTDRTWGFTVANLKRVDASNDGRELRVAFSAPSPDFLRNQALVKMISPKLIADKAVEKRASGTGPFKLAAWNKGQDMVLEANADYWGEGPYLDQVRLRSIGDMTTALSALAAGDVDVVMKVPPKQAQSLTSGGKASVTTKESWVEGHIIFRCDQAPLDDVRVRQAVAYAIDREALVTAILRDQAVVAHTPMPPGTYGEAAPSLRYTRDVEKAKALLAEAGATDVELPLSVFAGIRVLGEEVGQAVSAQLAEAGIRAKLDILEPGVAVQDLTAEQPKHVLVHAEYGWSNGGPLHFTLGTALGHPHYTGKELTDTVAKVGVTADGPEREQVLADAQAQFMEQLPHLPLYHLKLSDATATNVHGYSVPKDGYLPSFGQAFLA